jgi:1-acyl-sn-glycerol-3-phosphate acyltransferase
MLGDQVPRRGNAFSRWFGRTCLRLIGWSLAGEIPNLPKFVIIVAPHTSNWDFPVGMFAKFALGFRATFLGKDTLFRWPLGIVMRWLGGIPVFRHAPRNVVEQTIDHIKRNDHVLLVLSPEGTRKKLPAWRSGFHYVARGAGVPILPVALDYSTRTVRFFPLHQPAATVEEDLTVLGRHFSPAMAFHPAQY